MGISNIGIKNIPFLSKKVEESFNSAKDRESSSFYEQHEKKKELPKDIEELFCIVKEELKKFQESPFVKSQCLEYSAFKENDNVVVIVKNNIGKIIRRILADEFLKMAQHTSVNKGNIINSLY